MENHDHSSAENGHSLHPSDHLPNPRGRAFFWGGIGGGLLLILLLLTHGFGLWGGRSGAGEETPALVHQGGRIFVPEKSPLRERLTGAPAPAEARSAIAGAPGGGGRGARRRPRRAARSCGRPGWWKRIRSAPSMCCRRALAASTRCASRSA